ncbi:hypothetical protein ACH5RR_022445 [Cinchona calisaya]|uniref:PUM-HD domain-containing protein n=1 Tax=Cinchona calisaya TaxID=153742 RepID=A0ABD2Z8U6_9GENT
MKDDEELELLLGEIPHAISFNHHHNSSRHGGDHHDHNLDESILAERVNGLVYGTGMYDHGDHNLDESILAQRMNVSVHGMGMCDDVTSCYSNSNKHTCASPVSGFSLQSDGSSSSLLSVGHPLSDNGSPTTPPLEELKSHSHCGASTRSHYSNRLWMEMKSPDLYFGRNVDENVLDELRLSRNLGRMYVNEEPKDVTLLNLSGHRFCDRVSGRNIGVNLDEHGLSSQYYSKGMSDYGRFQYPVTGSPVSSEAILLGSRNSPSRSGEPFSHLYGGNRSVNGQFYLTKGLAGDQYVTFPVSNLSGTLARPSITEALYYAQRNGASILSENDAFSWVPQLTPMKSHTNVENVIHYPQPIANACNIIPPCFRVPHGSLEAFSGEESLIIQGESLNHALNRVHERSRQNKSYEADVNAHKKKQSLVNGCPQISGNREISQSLRLCCPFSLSSKCHSLAEAQGYIYYMAKDQHGCRFLQRIFDEGTPQDVQIIFIEIIDHVIELMMNPFGNYLMQKLLEVCNEEQRMQILLRVTAKPGELIRISLNTHGTRVVQKLIETLKSRQQISLVISSLEPGFLALIKDLNGNHVVQRCLQCLSNEDSKFIFVAAAKYCVDIATHQHGCCVLQRCISHSSGEHRENLIAEISANGLLLAQDAFGNYVVQFILELKIPSDATKLVSQFEGNYVHLSTQKFSSHVVEKCLAVCNNEVRSTLIHELLSATHFEQLLQDPHANYVVQTALKVSEGRIHNSLVEAIESHKAISRNSPYSKRIFSHKLLKK